HFGPAFYSIFLAGTLGDGCVFRIDPDFLGPPQVTKDLRLRFCAAPGLLGSRLRQAIQLYAQILENCLASGQGGNVFHHGLAAGALTAQTWRMPLSLFRTNVARASPSMSSAIISRGSFFWEMNSSRGMRLLALVIFSS